MLHLLMKGWCNISFASSYIDFGRLLCALQNPMPCICTLAISWLYVILIITKRGDSCSYWGFKNVFPNTYEVIYQYAYNTENLAVECHDLVICWCNKCNLFWCQKQEEIWIHFFWLKFIQSFKKKVLNLVNVLFEIK